MPATRTISTTIALNGEAAYRRSMEEINRSLRTLKAETQAAAAAFQSEGRSMQSLTSYQQRLQAQYDQLIVKQESLKQAVRDASRIYGDNSKEADRHRAALANVEAEMNRLQGEMNRTETELQELRQAEQGAADGANDMAGGMQGAAQSMGVSTIAIGNMLADLARRAARFLADAARAGIEYNAEMQSYTQALTNSLGSAEAAAAALSAIKLDAAVTPYSVAALTRANQLLIATGISAESARATINALSEAVSATGGGNDELQRMAQNLQQIQNVGKASAMDIKQFQMAGIDVYGILADYTGQTVQEVQDLTITYDLLSKALQNAASEGGKYFGANAAQAATLNGQISTLTDNIKSKLGEAMEGVSDMLSEDILPKVNEFVSNIDVGKTMEFFGSYYRIILPVAGQLENLLPLLRAVKGEFDTWDNATGNVESLALALDELMQRKAELEAMGVGAGGEGGIFDPLTDEYQTLLNQIAELRAEIARLRGEEAEASAEQETHSQHMTETAEKAQELADQIAALEAAYTEAYEAAKTSLEGQFDLFEKVDQAATISVQDMIAAMGTQADYWNAYSENLTMVQGLTEQSIGLNADLVAGLNDGSAKSVQAVASLAAGYEEALAKGPAAVEAYIASINAAYESQQAAIAGAADAMAKGQTDFDNKMADIQAKAEELVTAMDKSAEMGTAAYNSMRSYMEQIAYSEQPAIEQMFALGQAISQALQDGIDSKSVTGPRIAHGGNGMIAYDGSHASGLDYVPFDGYIAELHRGEMVLNAAAADALRQGAGGGGTVVNVTVNTREMSRSQTDYLIRQLNQELGKEA